MDNTDIYIYKYLNRFYVLDRVVLKQKYQLHILLNHNFGSHFIILSYYVFTIVGTFWILTLENHDLDSLKFEHSRDRALLLLLENQDSDCHCVVTNSHWIYYWNSCYIYCFFCWTVYVYILRFISIEMFVDKTFKCSFNLCKSFNYTFQAKEINEL